MRSTGGLCLGGQSTLKLANTHHTMLSMLVPGADSTIATASATRKEPQGLSFDRQTPNFSCRQNDTETCSFFLTDWS